MDFMSVGVWCQGVAFTFVQSVGTATEAAWLLVSLAFVAFIFFLALFKSSETP